MKTRQSRSRLCWFYIKCAGMSALPLYSDKQTIADMLSDNPGMTAKPLPENALQNAAASAIQFPAAIF
jgi:hypothetical protein